MTPGIGRGSRLAAFSGLAMLLLPFACGTSTASGGTPLPWSIDVEASYLGDRNREVYLEEIRSRVIRLLAGERCFDEIGTGDQTDLMLRIGIRTLDVSEDTRFDAPAGGGPGQYVTLGVTVTIGGEIEVTTGEGTTVLPPRKFYRIASAQPVTPLDEPLQRALDQAFDEPVRWADKYLCRKRDKLRAKALEAGLSE